MLYTSRNLELNGKIKLQAKLAGYITGQITTQLQLRENEKLLWKLHLAGRGIQTQASYMSNTTTVLNF